MARSTTQWVYACNKIIQSNEIFVDKFTYDDHDIMWLSVFSYVIVQKDTKINGVNEDKMIVIRK